MTKAKYGKTTNGLMKHMRKEAKKYHSHLKIPFISGSINKRDLLLMGYFHGYKACNFVINYNDKGKANKIPLHLKNFKQVEAIYNLDKQLKKFFYPIIMQVVTALKSRTIEVVTYNGGIYLNDIYDKCLYNNHNTNAMSKLNDVRKLKININRNILNNKTGEGFLLRHYIQSKEPIPLWSIFEFLTMGTFGSFLECLTPNMKQKLTCICNVKDPRFDRKYSLLSKHIFMLKDLRNAIAHNKMIFDCRFRGNDGIKPYVKKQLEERCHVRPITFNSIVDYFVLLVYYQHAMGVNKRTVNSEVNNLKKILKAFYDKKIKFVHKHRRKINRKVGYKTYTKIENVYDVIFGCYNKKSKHFKGISPLSELNNLKIY